MIFYEKQSQRAKSFRPWFILNCGESKQNVDAIAEFFENEILGCSDMDLEFNNKIYSVHLRVFPMVDSKLINLATGLGGAYW